MLPRAEVGRTTAITVQNAVGMHHHREVSLCQEDKNAANSLVGPAEAQVVQAAAGHKSGPPQLYDS